jgi:ubiquinone/menaquinone biosynthesis C-methylase UbiE
MKYFKFLINYIFSVLYDIYHFLFGGLRNRIQNPSFYKKSKLYPDYLKRGNMSQGIKLLAEKYCSGKGVDVGASNWPIAGARVIENKKEENAYIIKEQDNSLDFVFSSHCLEHLECWEKALKEWHRVLKDEGVLFLYLPHSVCEMWLPGVNKYHKWSPDPKIVSEFLEKELKMKIKEITYLPDAFMSFVIVAQK